MPIRFARLGLAAALTAASLPGLVVCSLASAQEPVVSSFAPLAVRPGASTNVVVRGGNLTSPTDVWTSFPAAVGLAPDIKGNGTNPGEATLKFDVPATAVPGIHGVRIANAGGVSGLKLFLVDDLPSVAQVKPNQSSLAPQVIATPVGVDGQIDGLARDYYKFTAAAGQRLSFEVVARRMGSALDPMLRLLDAKGRELAYNDDAPGLGADCQFTYVFREAGEYLLELRDIRYQGGPAFQYRLRIGDFPCVTSPYPMGVRHGSIANLSFAGPGVNDAALLTVQAPNDPGVSWLPVAAKAPNGQASGFTLLQVTGQDEALESEPNNVAPQATRVNLGANINGRFDQAGDLDRYVFTARAGQRYQFSAVTRVVGVPTDLYMKLVRADGAELAVLDDVGPVDGYFEYTFPADGEYTLVVEDLHRRGGPEFTYRIVSKPAETPVSLSLSTDTLNIGAGGIGFLRVTANRGPYGGPIPVSLSGAPAGIEATPVVIGPGRVSAVLTVRCDASVPAGKVHRLHVVGSATLPEGPRTLIATTTDAQRAAYFGLPNPPPMFASEVAVGVAPAPLYTLKADPPELVFGRDLTARTKIIATRAEGFAGEITLAVTPPDDGVPPNVAIAVAPIPANADEVEISFTANGQAPLGDFSVVVVGTGKLENPPMPSRLVQAAPALTLRLGSPFTLKPDFGSAEIERGKTLATTIRVDRIPSYSGPITLAFQNLPAGVTAAAATIEEGQLSVEVVLTAADDAAVGTVNNIVVNGEGVNGAAKLPAASAPVALTVK